MTRILGGGLASWWSGLVLGGVVACGTVAAPESDRTPDADLVRCEAPGDDAWGDGLDADCDGVDGVDGDGDGYPAAVEGMPWEEADCDDRDLRVHPRAADPLGDGLDLSCDGHDGEDYDRDGYARNDPDARDCDDEAPTAHPAGREVDLAACTDGLDNDCDGRVDADEPLCPLPSPCPAVCDGAPFQDITACAGIDVRRMPVVGDRYAFGQAWGDVDRDGWVDLFVSSNDGPNRLYRNQRDGTFAPFPFETDVALPDHESGGATLVDADGDGWLDLYVVGRGPNVLFRGLPGGGFEDATEGSGLDDPGQGQTAAWGDYDGDGDLDVFVANYECQGCDWLHDPDDWYRDRLFRNDGGLQFTDVGRYVGVEHLSGYGFAGTWADYDNDGDVDLYVTNDHGSAGDDEILPTHRNVLIRNDGPGCGNWCFTEVGVDVGADVRVFAMGLGVGDIDRNGWLDFLISDTGPPTLSLGEDGHWTDASDVAGFWHPGIGWGVVLPDIDLDGWLDAVVGVESGGVHQRADALAMNHAGELRPVLQTGLTLDENSWGIASADFDRDGHVDLVVTHDDRVGLYRNQRALCGEDDRWVAVTLDGAGVAPPGGVGARVIVERSDGMVMIEDVVAGTSLGSGHELVVRFGLGEEEVVRAGVRWPDGRRQAVDVVEGVVTEVRYPGRP